MKQKTELLLQLIAEKSATAGGFFTANAKFMQSEKNAAKLCRQQAEAGTLFRVRANRKTFGYFATPAMANAYLHQHQGAVLAKAETRISFTPKTPKRAKCSAETIYPTGYKYTIRLMPAPRNQVITHSFLHSGMGAM